MKKNTVLAALLLLTLLIVLPATLSVNYSASNPLVADGWPLPWPGPPGAHSNDLAPSEGWPLPWPAPPGITAAA